MAHDFPALTGFYRFMYLYFEPISTIVPAFMIWFYPGGAWFWNELVPGSKPVSELEIRSLMGVWQLASCFCLLGIMSSLVFRAIRDSLPNNPVAQERIVGAVLAALAIGDVVHVFVTLVAVPNEIIWAPSSWNGAFIGNVHFTMFLLAGRLSWFAGIGRKSYYYAVDPHVKSQ